MPQIFRCVASTGKVNDKNWIYLESDRWFDARAAAQMLFGTDQLTFETIQEKTVSEVEHQGNYFYVTFEGSPLHPHNPLTRKVVQWVGEASSQPSPSSPSTGLESAAADVSEPTTKKRKRLPSLLAGTAPQNGSTSKTGNSASVPRK